MPLIFMTLPFENSMLERSAMLSRLALFTVVEYEPVLGEAINDFLSPFDYELDDDFYSSFNATMKHPSKSMVL